jgi:LysM repeat protein
MIFVTVFSAGGGTSGGSAPVATGAPPQDAAPPPSVHIEQLTVPPEGLDYTVNRGDTLLAIGLRYGLPWERIADANGLDEFSLLQIDQILRIPGSGTPAVPEPQVETEEYTVQPNDTLFSIAARRGMYWDEVAAVNGFSEATVLQIGQVIRVPVVEEVVAAEKTPLVETRQKTVGPVTADESAQDFSSYSLMQFETSQQHGMPVATMQTGIGGPTTDVAIVAMAAGGEGGATATVLAEYAIEQDDDLYGVYVVQPGDTIISIAVDHDLEWGPLLTLNGLTDESVLQPGQTIRLR